MDMEMTVYAGLLAESFSEAKPFESTDVPDFGPGKSAIRPFLGNPSPVKFFCNIFANVLA